MSLNDSEMIKRGKNDSRPWKVIIFIIQRPFKHLFVLLGSLRYLRISGWVKMRVEWGRNDGFLWGKSPDFFPTPLLVRTSFGGHSKSSFLSGMTQNDLWTRNVVRMTGMKKGMTVNPRPFDPPSSPFDPPLPKSAGRSSLVPVIPRNEDLVSFRIILKWNDPETRDIVIFGSFHHKSFVWFLFMKWQKNNLEWLV